MSRCKANPCCGDPAFCEVPIPQDRTGLYHLNGQHAVATPTEPAVAPAMTMPDTLKPDVRPKQTLRDTIHDLYWSATDAKFPDAPELESFARGVEEGLSKALIEANKAREPVVWSPETDTKAMPVTEEMVDRAQDVLYRYVEDRAAIKDALTAAALVAPKGGVK